MIRAMLGRTQLHLPRGRRVGLLGTVSRVVLGLVLVGDVAVGHIRGPFRPLPWILGLVVLPASVLVWHWLRARRRPNRLEATGPIAHSGQLILFVAMLFLPDYVPSLWFTADTALVYYGSTMLFAAVLDQPDCEVLALSNWVLGRRDRLGCLIFGPFDSADRRLRRRGRSFAGDEDAAATGGRSVTGAQRRG